MNHAAVRHHLAEVARAARETLHDPAQAPRLWGQTTELCDVLQGGATEDSPCAIVCVAVREDIRAGARSTHELVDEVVWFVRTVEREIEDEELDEIVDGVVQCDSIDG